MHYITTWILGSTLLAASGAAMAQMTTGTQANQTGTIGSGTESQPGQTVCVCPNGQTGTTSTVPNTSSEAQQEPGTAPGAPPLPTPGVDQPPAGSPAQPGGPPISVAPGTPGTGAGTGGGAGTGSGTGVSPGS